MCELEVYRQQREKKELHIRLERERPHITKMREIMREQIIDENSVNNTMKKEWEPIASSGVLENDIPDPQDQVAIRDVLTRHYSEISDLYKWFSAVNSGCVEEVGGAYQVLCC